MPDQKLLPAGQPGGRWVIFVLALIGVVIMGYLLSLHYAPEGDSWCNLGEGLSCDIVNKSVYAKVMGIPLSLLGLLYFALVVILALFKYNQNTLRFISFASLAFLGPSIYLTIIELTVIKNLCVFCELSKVLMLAIVILGLTFLKREKLPVKNVVVSAIVAALILAGATYLAHASAQPTDEFNEFAQCLAGKNYIVYGSLGCSYCARQRAMFGDAFQFIKEIECDPRYPNAEVELCVSKQIEKTPTWIQEDASGNELYRFSAGLQSMEKLSEVSGCPLTPGSSVVNPQ